MTISSSSTAIPNAAGLRSRKVDLKKALAIFRADKVRDPDEIAAMTQLQTNVSTGVEKGEEEEHHLQAALVSRHAVVIPTPDASALADLPNYEKYYTPGFELSKNLIKHSSLAEQDMGCPYNMTEADLEWLKELDPEMRSIITDDDFEFAIYFLDECGNDKVSGECPEWDDIVKAFETKETIEYKPLMNTDALKLVYEYWSKARYQRNGGKLLRPILKSEEMSTNPDNDPYVCFRIREVKIHRKVRRSDTLAQEKLRRLKNDMVIVTQLLDLLAQRERARKDILEVNRLVFEKRMQVRRLKRFLGVNTADTLDASPEKTARKKHRLDERTSIRIPLQNLREAASIVTDMDTYLADDGRDHAADQRIEEKIKRERAIQEKSGWLDCTEFPFRPPSETRLWGPHLGIESRNGVHIATRRRMGRGGRIVFDRHVQFNRPSIDSRPLDPEEPSIALPPQISSLMYRGFALNQPTKGDGTQLLHNKPSKSLVFDPTIIPPIPQPPTEVINTPPSAPVNKKRTQKVSATGGADGTGTAGSSQQPSPAIVNGVAPSRKKKTTTSTSATEGVLDTAKNNQNGEKVKPFLKLPPTAPQPQMNVGGAGLGSFVQGNGAMNGQVPNQIVNNGGMNQIPMQQHQRGPPMQMPIGQPGQFIVSAQMIQHQLSLLPPNIQQQFMQLHPQQQTLFVRNLFQQQFMQHQQNLMMQNQMANGFNGVPQHPPPGFPGNQPVNMGPVSQFNPHQPHQMQRIPAPTINNPAPSASGPAIQISADGKIRMSKQEEANPDVTMLSI